MSLAVLADHMASKGRGNDSMLVHMTPREVAGLQALAKAHGGSLTINPDTGLPEAGWVDKLLPTIIGAGLTFFSGGAINPMMAAGIVGGVQTVRTGDIGKGLAAGLGAYGGAGLTAGLTEAGASTIGANEAAKGLAMTPELAAELQIAGEGAKDTLLQQQVADKIAAATPYEKLSAGFDAFKANPTGMTKSLASPLIMAAGPAIMAGANVQAKGPQTVTKPGMIRPYSYDPYGGGYVAGSPYEAAPTRAAEGGLMGMADGGYAPGQLDFAQRSEPVVRMAEGGIAGYADGGFTDQQVRDWFIANQGATDADIANAMQQFKVGTDQIARATGTQGREGEYNTRFVNTLVAPGTDASEFMAATKAVGLQDQALATAMQNAGLSAAGQYALTHNLSDAGGVGGTANGITDPNGFYKSLGYTSGALPGDQGGLEGLYANINYSASGLQDLIDSGAMTVAQAQNAALAEMQRSGTSVADIKAATGKDFGDLFTPKTVVKDTIVGGGGNDTIVGGGGNDTIVKDTLTCPPGYHKSIDGLSCVKDAPVIIDWKDCGTGYHWDKAQQACVKNTDATQHTTDTVDTPTSLITAAADTLPVGVSGTTGPSIEGGGATVNPNGTITTSPRIPGIPVGGFTGMEQVRDAYTAGGGSLGYTPFVPRTIEEFESKYNKLTGGSKQAYDYLMGKTPYSPTPYTPTGEVMKPYAESVLGMPVNKSKRMYIFDPATKTYKINPDYAIPTFDSKGVKSYNLTNKDVATFMDTKPSTEAFYTWATTNNLSPEQIAVASGRPINEISKLYTGAKALTGEDGKIDPAKVAEQEKTDFDYVAYLKANPDVQAELDKGIANFGDKSDLAAAAWNHYLTYGKAQGRTYTKKAKEGGLMAMARGGAAQFDLGDYSDGGRLLRGPGDGVSDSIPASIGNKRPARLADGEFVVPARIVSELGNGSTEAGARKLYAMMDRIQAARRGTVGKGKVAKNSRADKHLPA